MKEVEKQNSHKMAPRFFRYANELRTSHAQETPAGALANNFFLIKKCYHFLSKESQRSATKLTQLSYLISLLAIVLTVIIIFMILFLRKQKKLETKHDLKKNNVI